MNQYSEWGIPFKDFEAKRTLWNSEASQTPATHTWSNDLEAWEMWLQASLEHCMPFQGNSSLAYSDEFPLNQMKDQRKETRQ